MTIYHPNIEFDFTKIHLAQPIVTANGSFFSKINVSNSDDSLFIYTPKCVTRQGIVTTKDKIYTDLSFVSANTNIIQWIASLEERLQQLIYEKRDVWFATENIELDDIQNAFVPILKIYKNSNYLLRSYIQQSKHQLKGEPLLIYNESEQPCALTDITEKTQFITILEIQGVKFSQKCFHIPIIIKQIMVFQNTSFHQCLIKHSVESKEPEPPEIKNEPIMTLEINKTLEIPVSTNEPTEIDIDIHNVEDTINLKDPIQEYNAMVEKIKQSTLQAKEAYLIAKDLKQQFNIEDELPIL